jgi:serine/threonine protein kinase
MFFLIKIINLIGSSYTAIALITSLKLSQKRQILAYEGDEDAAQKLILPCYKPLYRFLIGVYAMFSITISSTFYFQNSVLKDFYLTNFYTLWLMACFMIPGVLLIQKSGISVKAFWDSFYLVGAWLVGNSILGTLCIWAKNHFSHELYISFLGLFITISFVTTFFLSCGILTHYIQSRIQKGSRTNESAMFLVLFSVIFLICNVICAMAIVDNNYKKNDSRLEDASSVLAFACLIANILYPLILYRTLLSDTKYWRGVGSHNKGGLSSASNVNSSTSIKSSMLIGSLLEASINFIDFAYLKIKNEDKIGEGSTSEVFKGTFSYKKKKIIVAIKVFNPGEITSDVIDTFLSECTTSSQLVSKYVVKFYGICIRPPQISFVSELCEFGSLKDDLLTRTDYWTPLRRLFACLHASKALEYLHSQRYIHRDIKPENFFVASSGVVKLGDFGESILYTEAMEADPDRERMVICGTTAYMAPELIRGDRFYTHGIDVFALGISMWEIWTDLTAFSELSSNFKVYESITNGDRPPCDEVPELLTEVFDRAWGEHAYCRPLSASVVNDVQGFIESYQESNNITYKEEDDVEDDEIHEENGIKIDTVIGKVSTFFRESVFQAATGKFNADAVKGGISSSPMHANNNKFNPSSPSTFGLATNVNGSFQDCESDSTISRDSTIVTSSIVEMRTVSISDAENV